MKIPASLRKIGWSGGMVCAALALSGCSKSGTAPVVAALEAKAPSAASAWNWEAYPPQKAMRLGSMSCQLQPKSMITMVSPLLGTLRVYISQPQTNLSAGTLWAEFEPEIFAAEKKSLEEQRVKLEEREKLQQDIEIPRQKLQLARQIEEMERQVSFLRLLSTNQELADLTLSVGQDNNPLRPESLAKSEMELQLLTQSLGYLEVTNSPLAGLDLSAQRTDWERRKLEFDKRQGQARFKMPFDGRLTLTIPLTEGVTEYPVNVGQELAVARDLSKIRLRVALANSAWTSLAAEQLTAVVRLPTGHELRAPFSYQKIERIQSTREESAYYFEFNPEQSNMAAKLVGTEVTCELWINFSEPVRIVPKMAVILHNPAALEGRPWSQGISATFPGATLAVEGQTDLGVRTAPLTLN